ncbi:Gfo/Idh/MocA family protein [Rhizobium beringeri]
MRRAPAPVFVNLIHDVDLFRYFFGEVEAVHAMESDAMRNHAVEDTAVVTLRFESGVLATLNGSDAVAAPWSGRDDHRRKPPPFPVMINSSTQIGGTKGFARNSDRRFGRALRSPIGWSSLPRSACLTKQPIPFAFSSDIFAMSFVGDATPP